MCMIWLDADMRLKQSRITRRAMFATAITAPRSEKPSTLALGEHDCKMHDASETPMQVAMDLHLSASGKDDAKTS